MAGNGDKLPALGRYAEGDYLTSLQRAALLIILRQHKRYGAFYSVGPELSLEFPVQHFRKQFI